MSDVTEFFLGSPSSAIYIETLEISHPDFTQAYWIVRNVAGGAVLTLETAAIVSFQYYPCKIQRLKLSNTLDQGFSITIGDVGDILNREIDAVLAANGFMVRPTVRYRAWRSDVPTQPLYGPIDLQIVRVSTNFGASTLEAVAPKLNVSATGELYSINRFPMLRGAL